MPSLYRRVSQWFNRRGSGSASGSATNKGSADSTPTSSPSTNNSASHNSASSVSSCSTTSLPSSCVLTRTAPSSYSYETNGWINSSDSVLLHEPMDMSYTPHPTQQSSRVPVKTVHPVLVPAVQSTTTTTTTTTNTAVPAAATTSSAVASKTLSINDKPAASLSMSAPTRHRRLVRPRHFTFSEAHVSRSGQGRLARTTAFF